jgi:hypothetical protein
MRYALMWLCLAAACSTPPRHDDQQRAPAAQPSTVSVMQHLLAEIERPGRSYEINADTFFARPDALATLVSAYESSDGAWTRWKLLRLAGKTRRADVRAFLKAEALKPVPRATAARVANATTVGNVELANRLEAAFGVVDGMPASESDVLELVASVDQEISRLLGQELYTRGLLTDSLVAALQARGLPTVFRRLSQSEERSLTSLEPSRWRKEVQP